MNIQFITSVNEELWQAYANLTVQSHAKEPRIYWQDLDTKPLWRTWRDYNRQHVKQDALKHQWERFSHKAEAQIELLREFNSYDYVVWIDADVVQVKGYTDGWLQAQMPKEDTLCNYIGRSKWPETGWIAYNMRHPRLHQFVDMFEQIYLSNRIFELEQWHDAFVWDYVMTLGDFPRHSITRPHSHKFCSFESTCIGEVFEHRKGKRKWN